VACDNPSEPPFQHAASLLGEMMSNKPDSVDYRSGDLHKPEESLRDYAEIIVKERIFDEYYHFRIASLSDGTFAIGVGTNNKKLERASKLALAVTLARQQPRSDVWLNQNGIALKGTTARTSSSSSARAVPREARVVGQARIGSGAHEAHWTPPSRRGPRPETHRRDDVNSYAVSDSGKRKRDEDDPPKDNKFARNSRNSLNRAEDFVRVKSELPDSHEKGSSSKDSADREAKDPAQQLMATIANKYQKPPDPWVLIFDHEKLAFYYWNADTHEAQWKAPPGSEKVSI